MGYTATIQPLHKKIEKQSNNVFALGGFGLGVVVTPSSGRTWKRKARGEKERSPGWGFLGVSPIFSGFPFFCGGPCHLKVDHNQNPGR